MPNFFNPNTNINRLLSPHLTMIRSQFILTFPVSRRHLIKFCSTSGVPQGNSYSLIFSFSHQRSELLSISPIIEDVMLTITKLTGKCKFVVAGLGVASSEKSFFIGIHPQIGSVCLRTARNRVLKHYDYWMREEGLISVRAFKGVNAWCHNLVLHGRIIHTTGISLSEIETRHLAYHHKVSLDFAGTLFDKRKIRLSLEQSSGF